MTENEYTRAIKYATKTLARPEYFLIKENLTPLDVVHDAYISLSKSENKYTLDNLIVHVRNAIGSALYKYIKSNPKLYELHNEREKLIKTKGREKLSKWYINQTLKQYGKEVNEKNVKDLRRSISLKRQGVNKYDIIEVNIPKIPENGIYLPDIVGYEKCIGYYINTKGELFSCRSKKDTMLNYWIKKTITDKGQGHLWIEGKTKTIKPLFILQKIREDKLKFHK